VHHARGWAESQFSKAEAQRATLNARAESARTRHEYETVIASYRRVVREAPVSNKADASAFAVAELTAEMGRSFKDDIALYSAVREYKFLRREYPGSKHRIQALLAISEIYQRDLGDEADARGALDELIRRYPHSQSAGTARIELDSLSREADLKLAQADDSGQAVDTSSSSSPLPLPVSSKPVSTKDRASNDNNDPGSRVVRVTGVKHSSNPDYTRITVDLEQDVQFESQRLNHPDRIFFDLKNARLAARLLGKNFDVDDGVVRKVRMAQYKPGRARIVIETADHASYNASLALNPPRLIINIHGDLNGNVQGDANRNVVRASANADVPMSSMDILPASTTTASGSMIPVSGRSLSGRSVSGGSLPDPVSPKKVIVEADDEDEAADSSATSAPVGSAMSSKRTSPPPSASPSMRTSASRLTTARSNREAQPTSNGDRSLIRALGLKIGKIVIDPGHGGHDTGTIGPNGLLEKDLVLDVSRRLGKMLESRLGAQVVFTRRDDTFIPLSTRTSIANQEQADLFVSVHANSSHDHDARGVETYYLNFTSSPEALEVAARENAASDQDIHQLQDLVKKIALKEKIEESREFASDVQQSLHSGLAAKTSGVRDRGVKKAPFVVLIGANMPSILAEISFISNPGDEKRLRTPEYRQRIAESLYRGISRYVDGLGGVKVASKISKASAE
jgi:N-acetylmuramoyl-L-alanine amidase